MTKTKIKHIDKAIFENKNIKAELNIWGSGVIVNIYPLYLIYKTIISINATTSEAKEYIALCIIESLIKEFLVAPNILKVENILLFLEKI